PAGPAPQGSAGPVAGAKTGGAQVVLVAAADRWAAAAAWVRSAAAAARSLAGWLAAALGAVQARATLAGRPAVLHDPVLLAGALWPAELQARSAWRS
ncbi:hypothetical protein, partial [Mycobacteroides abscessus]|uniref:hypothetical protein n=1 Tax=Mycobacteroides abscessus TaxID=36809 RepID=UPI001A96C8E7